MKYSELCVLVAAIASWELAEYPVTRMIVKALMEKVEGFDSVDGHLLKLSRLGFMEPFARDSHAAVVYRPTARGLAKVRDLRGVLYVPGLRGAMPECFSLPLAKTEPLDHLERLAG